MRSALGLFVLAAVMSAAASGLSTTSEFNTSLSTVDQLVIVQTDFSFPLLLPGASYSKDVTVQWALPAESLRDLKSDVVRVHVVAYAEDPSWLEFHAAGTAYRAYSFVLECRVSAGACTNASVLNHSFQVILRVPQNASTGHSERFFVHASLSQDYPSVPASGGGWDIGQGVQDFFRTLPWDQAAQTVQKVVIPVEPSVMPASVNDSVASNSTNGSVGLAAATSSVPSVQIGSAYVPAQTSRGSQASQTAGFAPALLPDGRDNISPIAGLVVTKDDAVFTGGVVVMILLAILFYRRFFVAQRASGLLEV